MCFSRPALGLVFFLSLASLPAHTVSVIVGEAGLSPDSAPAEASLRWESGFMDILFEAGHIVSNAPILRFNGAAEGDLPPEFRPDFFGAREGGVDYLVLVLLDYRGYAGTGRPRPDRVSLRLFRVSPYELLVEEPFPPSGKTAGNDDAANARQAAEMMLSHL